jgi:hypothetical protein
MSSNSNKPDETETNTKRCFVITPIGAAGSTIRRKIDGVIECAIKPALKEYDIIVSHQEINSGSIKSNIIKNIYDCELVIANLTTQNANVMYEVALRHAVAKPIIHITENLAELPFDINDHRTIEYTDDMMGVQELKINIEKMVNDIKNSNDKISNPIVDSLGKTNIIELKDIEINLNDAINGILTSIKDINERITLIERNTKTDFYVGDSDLNLIKANTINGYGYNSKKKTLELLKTVNENDKTYAVAHPL